VTLESNQVLTEFSNRNISWGPIIMKSGSLNLLEASRPVQARTRIVLTGDSNTVGRGAPRYISIFFFGYFCVLFFQTASMFIRQMVIGLLGPSYLKKGSVRYFFWPRGIVKKKLLRQ
jgi:hypothetical protein